MLDYNEESGYLPTSMATSCHGSMFILRAISAVFSPMDSWVVGGIADVIGSDVPGSDAAAQKRFFH